MQFLDHSFSVHEDHFKQFTPNSFIVLDDFMFSKANSKQEKSDFLKVINFNLRHQKITLVLIIHNLYNTNLSNEILLAPYLFLSYSNLGYNILR